MKTFIVMWLSYQDDEYRCYTVKAENMAAAYADAAICAGVKEIVQITLIS